MSDISSAGIAGVAPGPSGTGTQISVHVLIPEREAHRVDARREVIRQSLTRLADIAATEQAAGSP